MRRHITFDPSRCIGCHTCEALCKSVHSTFGSLTGGWIEAKAPVLDGVGVRIDFRFKHCMHCGAAPCLKACPSKAISRNDDGLVLLDTTLCTGCGACVAACPHHAVRLDNTRGKAVKCDLCQERLDRTDPTGKKNAGLQPACVTGCTARALGFVDEPARSELA